MIREDFEPYEQYFIFDILKAIKNQIESFLEQLFKRIINQNLSLKIKWLSLNFLEIIKKIIINLLLSKLSI